MDLRGLREPVEVLVRQVLLDHQGHLKQVNKGLVDSLDPLDLLDNQDQLVHQEMQDCLDPSVVRACLEASVLLELLEHPDNLVHLALQGNPGFQENLDHQGLLGYQEHLERMDP